VRLRLADLRIERPRQWGACWLACTLYDQLDLDRFWAPRSCSVSLIKKHLIPEPYIT
jgi:hypothetical protein